MQKSNATAYSISHMLAKLLVAVSFEWMC